MKPGATRLSHFAASNIPPFVLHFQIQTGVVCKRGRGFMNIRTLALFLAAGVFALAQQTGRLTGTVLDPAGAVVPKANVSLLLEEGNAPLLKATTSSEGIFDFIGVRPGRYRLQIESANFARYVQSNVDVETARQITLPDIRLVLS